jgi:translocation and assembly module TamA
LLVAALALILVPAGPAAALDLFGHKLFDHSWFGFGDDDEERDPDAQPYEVEFVVAGGDEDLDSALKGASQLYQRRDDNPPSTAGFLARGRGDYQRLLAALYGQARYGGVILITVNGAPVEAIPADANLPDPSKVKIAVDPGPLFRFGRVSIANEPPPVPFDDTLPKSPVEIGFLSGEPARSGVVLEVEKALVGLWRENGYPKARIASRNTVARQREALLDVAIAVDPGPPAVIGDVSVTGAERMNPEFVAWYSALRRGRRFDPDDLETARGQLRRLEVFQGARIVEDAPVSPAGELPLTINVAERPLRVFGVGASYSTLDGAGIEGYWQHRNLFGEAERLRFDGRIGGVENDAYEDYDYYAATTFLKPGVYTPFTDFEATMFARQEIPDTFRERTVGARAGFHHRFSKEHEARSALSFEAIEIEDGLGKRSFTLVSLPTELVYDTRDNRLDATKGYRLATTFEPFHETVRRSNGLITRIDGSTYFALDPESRFVLAGRSAIGSIIGASREDLPASRLFFAGGGGSVRGYAYKNLGPRLVNGEVVGGRSLFEASAELRARVTENISVVPFVDFGNAFEETFPDFSEPLKVGAGVGLRYRTGLGPLRLDVAFPLDPDKDDPDYALYVGLGQAF